MSITSDEKVCQLFNKFREYKKENIREGQALFLALEAIDSQLAEEIRGTNFDCFYDDENKEYFLEYVILKWYRS